jgi:putative oxidoreductase
MNEKCGDWKKKARNAGILALRLLGGSTIAFIGYNKVFGGQMPMLIEGVGKMGLPFPTLMAWLAALSEFAGGICIVLGLGTRIASFFLFITMCVAFFVAHANDPFPVKMPAFLYGTIALSLTLIGGGCWKSRSYQDN